MQSNMAFSINSRFIVYFLHDLPCKTGDVCTSTSFSQVFVPALSVKYITSIVDSWHKPTNERLWLRTNYPHFTYMRPKCMYLNSFFNTILILLQRTGSRFCGGGLPQTQASGLACRLQLVPSTARLFRGVKQEALYSSRVKNSILKKDVIPNVNTATWYSISATQTMGWGARSITAWKSMRCIDWNSVDMFLFASGHGRGMFYFEKYNILSKELHICIQHVQF